MLKVGVIGYSAQKFSWLKAHEILYPIFWHLQEEYGTSVEIVSGLTYMGIPGLAYELADEFGFLTTGIACKKAGSCVCYPVDMVMIEGDDWGDASEKFVNYCDQFVRVGGGKNTLSEMARIKELGKKVLEFELEVIA